MQRESVVAPRKNSSLAIWPREVSRFALATVLMWFDACRTVASAKTANRHCKIRRYFFTTC